MSDKDEIFNYVMNTPDNTNPAILRGMLNDLNDGGDPGYDVKTVTVEVIPEQTVTLEDMGERGKLVELTFVEGFDAAPETLSVVLNGDEYELTKEDNGPNNWLYNFPLEHSERIVIGTNIETGEFGGGLVTGHLSPLSTVTISATTVTKQVTVTDDFKDAVDFCTGYSIKTSEVIIIPEQTVTTEPDVGGRVALLTLTDGVEPPWPETLNVTFNGTEYELTGEEDGSSMRYTALGQFDVIFDTNIPTGGVILCDVETVTISATTTEETTTVTDGFKAAMKAAAPSGGGDVFAVNFTFDGAREQWVCDKTYDEVASALSAGQNVIGFWIGGGDYGRHSYSSFEAQQTELGPRFYFRYDNGLIRVIKIAGNGNISTDTLPGDRLVVYSSWSSDDSKYVLDHTWEDINNAYAEQIPVYIHEFGNDSVEHGFFLVNGVRSIDTGGGVYAYVVVGFNPMNSNNFSQCHISYVTDSEDGYPAGNYPMQ